MTGALGRFEEGRVQTVERGRVWWASLALTWDLINFEIK